MSFVTVIKIILIVIAILICIYMVQEYQREHKVELKEDDSVTSESDYGGDDKMVPDIEEVIEEHQLALTE